MHIKSIVLYPIKSCQGIELEKCFVDERGLVDDRSMMLVFENGKMLTQRDLPQLSLVQPGYAENGNLLLAAPGLELISIPLRSDGPERQVSVWQHNCLAIDQGDEVAQWLTEFLAVPCRLVRIGRSFERSVNFDHKANAQVGFADHSPMVIATCESLDQLNQNLCEPLMISRFRANIILSGCQLNEEYRWDEVDIGPVKFQVVKDCARCSITTVEQESGVRTSEPLKTLSVIGRRSDRKPVFGVHAMPTTLGEISLASQVHVKVSIEESMKERAAIP